MKQLFLSVLVLFLGVETFAQKLVVNHLSDVHTMVKVQGKDRFVLLPVQETAPEAKVKLLADTREIQSFKVNLAIDKVDYFVPLDLNSLEGKNILLDVIMVQGRGVKRDPSDDVCWSEIKTAPVFDRSNKEKFRPTYHFSPDYGWMNDPNGMVYANGEWHLFFQFNPFGSIWGNMNWGHAVSKDLSSWEQLDIAIAPDALGTIFSGSAVIDKDNVSGFGHDAIVAMFTSDGDSQTQSLAWSNDGGRTFTKFAGNPVIVPEETVTDFRDPKMFYDEKTRQWKVVLAAGQEVMFYSSDNLLDWTYDSSFGMSYGNHNGVWECPDLIKLNVDGKDKYVLLVNINPGGPFGGSATQYFIGNYDGRSFKADELPTVTRWMDYGKDHYAAVTWHNAPQGRTVAIAWMSNWQYARSVPTEQFRSSNSIPRDLSLIKRGKEILLKSSPAIEMESLRGNGRQIQLSTAPVDLFESPQKGYELILRFQLPKKEDLTFVLTNEAGEQVVMTYDSKMQNFSMDRRGSGSVKFSKSFPTITSAPTRVGGKMELRLFIDTCSIEAFGEDFCMTNLVFPSSPYNTIKMYGNVKADITLYPLSK